MELKRVLSNKSLNAVGYYPLSDCDLLCFTGNCPLYKYNLESCNECPFKSEYGNDYFQMGEFYDKPIKESVEKILRERIK